MVIANPSMIPKMGMIRVGKRMPMIAPTMIRYVVMVPILRFDMYKAAPMTPKSMPQKTSWKITRYG